MLARCLIWAHRGASAHAPENTTAAFELAHRMGADGVELDARLCATGEPVVVHDPDMSRVAGSVRRVRDTTFRELRALDVGFNERVPSLEEAIEACADMLINIELKVDGFAATGLEQAVADAVRRTGAGERVLLSCFHPAALWRSRALLPKAPLALLFGSGQRPHLRRGWHGLGLRLAAVHPEHNLVDRASLDRWHRSGLSVNTWTVNDPRRARKLSLLGVDGIITDQPGVIRAALEGVRAPALGES